MNNVALKISKNLPLSFIYWLPRLVYLQLLWFLAVLPVITLVTASRAILDSLTLCQKQETPLNHMAKIYKNFFHSKITKKDCHISYSQFLIYFSNLFYCFF